jgi:outer membrane autotransporter protein
VVAQSATVDHTQIGANGSIDSGPWTFSTAVIYGFGNIHANRSDGGGAISAAYDTWLFGAVNEVSYYWSSGNWRLVPKVGIDFTHIHNDAFAESGGTLPVSATAQVTNRARAFAGAEAGYSWFVDKTLYDISAYGRAVEIIHQSVDAVTLTALDGTSTPSVVPGVTDARFEFDAGASASVRLSNLTRLYAVYDGRFRDGFTAHAGTLGIEFRW